MKRFLPHKVILYQLYLLQLELFEIPRFLSLIIKTRGVPIGTPRKKIVWTAKLTLIGLIAITLLLICSFIVSLKLLNQGLQFINSFAVLIFIFVVLTGVLSYFFFIFLAVSTVLILPFDKFSKLIIIALAKTKLKKYPHLKIVGIAGSYGKTTMKEVVSTILGVRFKVLKTPENINTPLGIAQLILKKLNRESEIFVVEMGEFYRGDIKVICNLVRPQFSFITGINEAHLERLKTIENAAATIFEIVDSMDPKGVIFLNQDDRNIEKYYATHPNKIATSWYSSRNKKYSSTLLGNYANGTIDGAVQLARKLALSDKEIKTGITAIVPIKHRLEPIQGQNGILVIDDSYNGNPEGVKEAIDVLKNYSNRRKIFITPGLVEMGPRKREVHLKIGMDLVGVANQVILIKNSVTPYIASGLEKNGFKKENIIWFDNAQAAHAGLKELVQPNDVVLFQNDWPDNYI